MQCRFHHLPARSLSYEPQRRLVKAAVQNPFLDSVQTIADLTGVSVSKRSLASADCRQHRARTQLGAFCPDARCVKNRTETITPNQAQ